MNLKKTILLISLSGLYFINPLNAEIKGDYIVTSEKDTVEVVVKSSGWDGDLSLICKVNGKKTVYLPENTLYYKHGDDIYESAFISGTESGRKKWHFLKRLTTEKLILLLLFTTERFDSHNYLGLYYYCRRPNQTREKIQGVYDISNLYDICSDCPKLVEQLKSKNPVWQGGIENAVQYYIKNQNCN